VLALPIYVWVIVLSGLIGTTSGICVALWLGAHTAGLNRRTAAGVVTAFALAWAGWAVTSGALAAADVYHPRSETTKPWIGVAVFVSLAAALLLTRVRVVSRIFAQPDALWQLTFPQVFRLVGVAFLVVLALGKLPAVFALPAGLGDVAVGLEALLVARGIRRGVVGRGVLWFNLLGLLDLIVALGIGFTAFPGPARVLFVTPSTESIALLPLVLIPTTVVPLAAALHLMSLAKLRAAKRSVTTGNPAEATT